MGKYTLRSRQKMKTMHKTVFLVAGASMLGLAAYMTIFMNTTQVTTSKAGLFKNMMAGYEINNGETIVAYSFDADKITKADTGPDAVSVSDGAVVQDGGSDNTQGLSPGKGMAPLNFEIPAIKELNLGGIDVSLDYRKSENDCNLFTRGKQFNLGVKEGRLAVSFKVKQGRKTTAVSEVTRYEIPDDDEFRNYRFMFDPVKGMAEIFVNGVVIWSHATEPESNLAWKESDNLVVGQNLKGDGTNKVFIDNVLVKATRQVSELPVTLLNFEAKAEKDYVMVTWFTASEMEIDSFVIERSLDAKTFTEVGKVKAKGAPNLLTAYAVIDKSPNEGLAYYRLAPSNLPIKSMTISMIGYKYRGAGGDLKITDVQPQEETQK